MKIIAIGDVNAEGKREVFCEVNGQLRTFMRDDKKEVQVRQYNFFWYYLIYDTLCKQTAVGCGIATIWDRKKILQFMT